MIQTADDRLRDEVRLLGGLLGEVIRDEGGQDLYDRIEAVRQASVAWHRDAGAADAARLEQLLGALSLDDARGKPLSDARLAYLLRVAEDETREALEPLL